MKVVHHPNPNEVAAIGKIIETYRVTILLSTPTFISNIVRASAGRDLTSASPLRHRSGKVLAGDL